MIQHRLSARVAAIANRVRGLQREDRMDAALAAALPPSLRGRCQIIRFQHNPVPQLTVAVDAEAITEFQYHTTAILDAINKSFGYRRVAEVRMVRRLR